MLTYRVLQPCSLCEEGRPICTRTRAACHQALLALEREAMIAGERMPDGEVVLDCLNFRAIRRTKRMTTHE